MKEPVDFPGFWKGRLERARSEGKLWYSVYLTHKDQWMNIEKVHAEVIANLIMKDCQVLDAGCGYGRLAHLFDPDHYTGIDFSPDLLEEARKKNPSYFFAQDDLTKIPYADKNFDWAICSSIKQMIIGQVGMPKWRDMEKELRRVARRVLILEYPTPEQYEILESL